MFRPASIALASLMLALGSPASRAAAPPARAAWDAAQAATRAWQAGDLAQAEADARRVIQLWEKDPDPRRQLGAVELALPLLTQLGHLELVQATYAKARAAIRAHGGGIYPAEIDRRLALARARVLFELRRVKEADAIFDAEVASLEADRGPNDQEVMLLHLEIAGRAMRRRAYALAEARHELVERRAMAAKDSLLETTARYGRALAAWRQGEADRAVKLLRRNLERTVAATSRQAQGSSPAGLERVTGARGSLARALELLGKQQEADVLWAEVQKAYESEIARIEREHGATSPLLAPHLQRLALFHRERGRTALAEPLLVRAERIVTDEPLPKAESAYVLGIIRRDLGRIPEALKLLEAAVPVIDRHLGSLAARTRWFGLAETYRMARDHAKARAVMRRVLRTDDAAFGKDDNGWRPFELQWLSFVELDARRFDTATARMREAFAAMDARLATAVAAGTEEAARTFFASMRYQLDLVTTLAAAHAPAADLALQTVLRRKASVLDVQARATQRLRARLAPAVRELFDRLVASRQELAARVMAGGADRAALAQLSERVRRLEQQLRMKSPAFAASETPVTAGAVAKALPTDGALVELLRYQVFRPAAPRDQLLGEARYAAWIVRPGRRAAFVPLGPAEPIEGAVKTLREALASPDSQPDESARDLYDRLVAPLATHLGGVRHLFVSPDGPLALVPFGALRDPSGRWLLQRMAITLVTSGRDLVTRTRAPRGAGAGSGDVVVAAPEFGGTGQAVAARRSRALAGATWSPLPGTSGEAQAIRQRLESPIVLTGAAATETALKRLKSPRLLHLATHGFFLPAESAPRQPGFDILLPGLLRPDQPTMAADDPLLRSGLVLAGANARHGDEDDGILTALEASSLDLSGTELVVLSACDTGLGDAGYAEGVRGLRRALTIAGARSLIMSLWQVDDEATRRLMGDLYRRLAGGAGRADALRAAQLSLARRPETAHPAYWAAFVLEGDSGPLPARP